MVNQVFSGGRLVCLSLAVVVLTAALAHAAPLPIRHPLPPPVVPHVGRPLPLPGGPPIGHPFTHPRYGVRHPYHHPHFRGSYFRYSSYSYVPSYSNYGATLTAPANDARTAEEKDVAALLAASGVPTDEAGPVWPLALRFLPGQEAQALRGQIDGLLQVAATQAARGQPNTAVVEELAQATDHLRKLLLRQRQERGGLAQRTYEDAERFLDKLAGAQKLLR